jgi:hypothetical protein
VSQVLRRGSNAVVAAACVCALISTRAAANPDHRPQDRFFFGLSFGSTANPDMDGSYQPAVGYETSYWPNDWIGMGTLTTLSQSMTYDWGGELMIAAPLRYVQPYIGAHFGLRTATDRDIAGRVDLFAGVNIYASRNLRVFGELRDIPDFDYRDLTGGTHEELVMAGLRWSPDWFHSARNITKIDTLWWSTVLTFTAWGVASLAR